MLDDQQREELRGLIDARWDDTLTEEQAARLQELVCGDDDACRFYLDYMAINGLLVLEHAEDRPGDLLLTILADDAENAQHRLQGASKSRSPVLDWLGGCFDQGASFLSKPLVLTLLVAIALPGILLSLLFIHVSSQPVPEMPAVLARVTQMRACVWRDADAARSVGEGLAAGEELRLDKGLAELAFADGARLIVEGPAELSVESSNRAALRYGSLSATVNGKRNGFVVDGPSMKVVDIGTEFGVSVDREGQGQVHVFRGEVEVALVRGDGRSLQSRLLTEHEAVTLDSQANHIAQVRFDPARFIRTFEPSGLDIRREYVEAVKADGPIAYWRFEYLDKGRVLNEMGDRYYGHSLAKLVFSPDVQNRTLAVDQRRQKEQYMLVQEPLTELVHSCVSMEFWFRPDCYQFTTPVILYYPAPRGDPATTALVDVLPNWKLPRYDKPLNRFRLLYRVPPSGRFRDGVNCYSDEEYVPGRWYHVVGVIDETVGRLFVNGKRVGEVPVKGKIDEPPFVSIGRPMFVPGREGGDVQSAMSGQIDEVAIYAKALSDEQVRTHFQLVAPRDK